MLYIDDQGILNLERIQELLEDVEEGCKQMQELLPRAPTSEAAVANVLIKSMIAGYNLSNLANELGTVIK